MQVRLWPNIGHHLWNKSFEHCVSAASVLKNYTFVLCFFVWNLKWDIIQGTICILNVVLSKPEVCSSESELWEWGLPQGVDQWASDWLPCQIKIRPLFHHLIPANLLWRNLGSSRLFNGAEASRSACLPCLWMYIDSATAACQPALVSAFKSGLQSSLRGNKVVRLFFFFHYLVLFLCLLPC